MENIFNLKHGKLQMQIKFGAVEKYCENCDAPCDSPKSCTFIIHVDTTLNHNAMRSEYVEGEFALCEYCAATLLGMEKKG
jgi:hypothetical protein